MIPKIISLLFIVSVYLFAIEYDSTIVLIEAKLFPKMALLEENITNNSSAYLNISIVAKEIDFSTAKIFQSNIESLYPDVIRNKKIRVKITQFDNSAKNETDVVIVLHHSAKTTQKIALWANKNKILSFAYEPSDLQYGLLASVYIGRTAKPYLNIQTMKEHGFMFNSFLMQLSKFKK